RRLRTVSSCDQDTALSPVSNFLRTTSCTQANPPVDSCHATSAELNGLPQSLPSSIADRLPITAPCRFRADTTDLCLRPGNKKIRCLRLRKRSEKWRRGDPR